MQFNKRTCVVKRRPRLRNWPNNNVDTVICARRTRELRAQELTNGKHTHLSFVQKIDILIF